MMHSKTKCSSLPKLPVFNIFPKQLHTWFISKYCRFTYHSVFLGGRVISRQKESGTPKIDLNNKKSDLLPYVLFFCL